ncbi:hypothetical protein FB451DRAFT_993537, partial [Mycena latifolia]
FLVYSTPLPSVPYSASSFAHLTFRTAAELKYPTIYAPKTLSAWTFVNEVSTDLSTIVEENEVVPHMDDLSPIIKAMEEAFDRGARAVAVTLAVAGQKIDYLYSFSKVRLELTRN